MPVAGEVLARMLDGYGVTHVFHVPAVLRRTMVEIERHTDIKRVRPHGEKSAAYMADGYARASGKPGICMAQVVGALNLAAGLRDAHLANAPVIAMTGGRFPATKFRQVYQEVDDVPAFEPVTKWNATIDDASRIPDMLRQAFRVATSGAPGPVHLQFQGNEGQIDLDEIDEAALVEEQYTAVPPHRPVPESPTGLAEAVQLLEEADRPVIVAGGGVRSSGGGESLIRLAESLGIPVATSLNGKDAIPANHPLSVGVVGTYSRASANRVVGAADLVFFVGTETGGMTTHFWQVPLLDRRVIQLDIEPQAIGRNYPPLVALHGDARAVLDRMQAFTPPTPPERDDWVDTAAGHVAAWYDEWTPLLTSDAIPIRPERIVNELSRHTPADAIVVVDTGHAGMWMGGMYDVSAGQSYIRSAGHLGWAFPAALGAKCAAPDRPVVCFTGDSGFWYHIAEIETAVRWDIAAVTVVNNNSSGNQSKRGFDRAYGGVQSEKGAHELWKFTDVDFAALAEQIGALGIRVERPGEFVPALERAVAGGRPAIIDVVTDIDALAPLAVTD